MYNHIEKNMFTDKLEVLINAHIVKYANINLKYIVIISTNIYHYCFVYVSRISFHKAHIELNNGIVNLLIRLTN